MEWATHEHLEKEDDQDACYICCYLKRETHPEAFDQMCPPENTHSRRAAEDAIQAFIFSAHGSRGGVRYYESGREMQKALQQMNLTLMRLKDQMLGEWVENHCGLILSQMRRTSDWQGMDCWDDAHSVLCTNEGPGDLRGNAQCVAAVGCVHWGTIILPHDSYQMDSIELSHMYKENAESLHGGRSSGRTGGASSANRMIHLWRTSRGRRSFLVFSKDAALPRSDRAMSVFQHKVYWNVFAVAGGITELLVLTDPASMFNPLREPIQLTTFGLGRAPLDSELPRVVMTPAPPGAAAYPTQMPAGGGAYHPVVPRSKSRPDGGAGAGPAGGAGAGRMTYHATARRNGGHAEGASPVGHNSLPDDDPANSVMRRSFEKGMGPLGRVVKQGQRTRSNSLSGTAMQSILRRVSTITGEGPRERSASVARTRHGSIGGSLSPGKERVSFKD